MSITEDLARCLGEFGKRISQSTWGALQGPNRVPKGRALKDDCRGGGGGMESLGEGTAWEKAGQREHRAWLWNAEQPTLAGTRHIRREEQTGRLK